MPTPLEILLDPISLFVIAMYGALMLWEAFFPGRQLPEIKMWKVRGIVAFVVYFYLSSYLPLFIASYIEPFRLLDLSGLSALSGGLLGILIFELGMYAWHFCLHKSNFLWRTFHQMHHSAERLDTYGAFYFSPFDMIGWTVLSTICFSLIVGLSPQAITVVLLVTNFFSIFQHANIKTPKWLGYFIQRPESHTYHHAKGIHKYNYSDLPLFDILFGTFHNPKDFEYETGFYQGASGRIIDMLFSKDVSEPEEESSLKLITLSITHISKKISMTMKRIKNVFIKESPDLFRSRYFLTDGGLETTMIFNNQINLPHFAAFELVYTSHGRALLKKYHEQYILLAQRYGFTYILETPTWRANPDWGYKLGYDQHELNKANRHAVLFMREIQNSFVHPECKILISGCVGPRGDGYSPTSRMTELEAADYHAGQIRTFALADVDVITAMTLNYSDEAIGIVQAAKGVGVPVVISFTVETDGNLPSGENLHDAIMRVDAITENYAQHFMINCAHPDHFNFKLKGKGDWKKRIRGIRANASTKSHAELDESTSLDPGDKHRLAKGYGELKESLPELFVIGGCCGTDHTHLEEICKHIFDEGKNLMSSLSA